VARQEGDVAPVLFRNETEQVDIVYSRDIYIIRYRNEPRFSRDYQAGGGLLQ
jgi:hypothetical protein